VRKSSFFTSASSGSHRGVLPFLVGAAAIGIGAALPATLAWAFLHPPRRLHRTNPRAALGVDYERFTFKASDGVSLRGWYVPAPGGKSPRGVVVVSHGYYGNRATMIPYLRFLHQDGYAAVVYDFRAHGWSGGRMATFGCHEPLDLLAALDWVRERRELRDLPLALLGESMGASVSLMVAAEVPEVRCVVADSPYARFDSAVEGRLKIALGPVAPVVTPRARRVGERMLGVKCEEIAPIEAIARIAPRPVFLIHGLKDRLIIPENSRRIRDAAPGNATLWEVPSAAHVMSVYVAGEEYGRRVLEFLNQAIGTR
jgi:fermentation-respiration switch protein FrsA (DUF1100 family)